jgi:hypothetical protein
VRKRTFSLPEDLDIALRRRAVDDGVRFSDAVVSAVRMYLESKKETKKREK